MGSLGAPEIIIIAVVLVLLFGAAKLPIFAKSLGESLRIFKREVKGPDSHRTEIRGPELPPILADQDSTQQRDTSQAPAGRGTPDPR